MRRTTTGVKLDAPEHDYSGPAALVFADREVSAHVDLRGHIDPIDGRFRWYGRVAATAELVLGGRTEVIVRTGFGTAPATIGDPDPWGRYRLLGRGRPPFPPLTD